MFDFALVLNWFGFPTEVRQAWRKCPPLDYACAWACTFMNPCRFGTVFQFPQEPKAAGQLEDALFTWVFGEMAELISASELFAICSQFLRVESYYTAFNCYPAPTLLLTISGIKSFWPLGR